MEWNNFSNDANIQSTPKLTRLIHLDSTKFRLTVEESETQDQNGGEEMKKYDAETQFSPLSLPALAGEVADAQKQQVNELKKRQTILEELQVGSQQ